MNVFVVFLLCAMVSVMSQSTLLYSQCDNECYLEHIAEIKSLTKVIENLKGVNVQLEKKIMELESKVTKLINENVMGDIQIRLLQKKLKMQKDAIMQLIGQLSVDCEDIRLLGYSVSGVYSVNGGNGQIKQVYCEMSAGTGAWTRILHRQDNLTDFTYKTWADYEAGFGDPHGSHWMGLIQLSKLTNSRKYALRVDLWDWEGDTRDSQYTTFRVGPASDKYRLTVVTLGPLKYLNNMMFTTIDQDNDRNQSGSCAAGTENRLSGGWWYNDCFHTAHLTGPYMYPQDEYGEVPLYQGLHWPNWKGSRYSYKVATMKIQRL